MPGSSAGVVAIASDTTTMQYADRGTHVESVKIR